MHSAGRRGWWLGMALAALTAGAARSGEMAAEPYIWLEKPARSRMTNDKLDWPVLTDRQAFHLAPPAAIPDAPFVEFAFTVPDGVDRPWRIWGRTFDPNWSSVSRWRVDDGAWSDWKPAARVDREVHNKAFAIDWCLWGERTLAPGPHTLRLEMTDKRARGDYHYFVMDALCLTPDPRFIPAGRLTPVERAEALRRELETVLADREPDAATERLRANAAVALRRAESDLAARVTLETLLDAARRDPASRRPDTGQIPLLHGRVETPRLDGGDVVFSVRWNRPWSGRYWVGLTHERALYAVHADAAPPAPATTLEVRFPRPANLPAGRVAVEFVPIGVPWALTASSGFTVPGALAAAAPRPAAWGVYRDRFRHAHPWSVTPGNLLLWEGEPFIPFGGMVNTRLSWATKTGDPETGDNRRGYALLDNLFALLKKHGLRDIYFNAFFLRSNPDSLRAVVALAEKHELTYGLEITSRPDHGGKGFVYHADHAVPVAAGAASARIAVTTAVADGAAPKPDAVDERFTPRPPHRAAWVLLDADRRPMEWGVGVFDVAPGATERHAAALTLDVRFARPAAGAGTLVYLPEATLASADPMGYLEGLADYRAKIRAVYGVLPLGPGLRFFVDPFVNEMHYPPRATPTGPEFRRRYAAWLAERYADPARLNAAWGADPDGPGGRVPDFAVAARLVAVWTHEGAALWLDPETGAAYRCAAPAETSLRDFKEFRGGLAAELISSASDTLKSVADVPVIVKHNTWFNDWFVNPAKTGGFDGVGMEPYCYGDSLAYHNSIVAYAEAMQSARDQWCLVTETSAAAFEGQKDYPGHPDRLQFLHDFDQLAMLGAKGFYTFGFSFDPDGGRFFTTELPRDPRQLEWLATLARVYRAAAPRLAAYRPEVWGWYPGYLREREPAGGPPPPYAVDGNYMARPTQIRMMPDGRWLVPALTPHAPWKGLLVDVDRLTPSLDVRLATAAPGYPVHRLTRGAAGRDPALDAFTAQGIGLVPASPSATDRLAAFRSEVLRTEAFQTRDANGYRLPDGDLLLWTASEKKTSRTVLPPGAEAFSLAGDKLPLDAGNAVVLTYGPREKLTDRRPPYIPNGYHYADDGQPEACRIKNATAAAVRAANPPARERYYPAGLAPEAVKVHVEAEDFASNTFGQPSLEGYSQYSGRALGLNTHFPPPADRHYEATYTVSLPEALPQAVLRLRRMAKPAVDLAILLDGREIGAIPRDAEVADQQPLSPWNAGLSLNKLTVGWTRLPLGALAAGNHRLTIRATGPGMAYETDTALMGEAAGSKLEKEFRRADLQAAQIDCFLITTD